MWGIGAAAGIDSSGISIWMIASWVFGAACLIGLFRALIEYVVPRNLRDVDPSDFGQGPWPSVAVIAPARDEEAMIRQAAESLLVLDYESLAVVIVDDRSTDRTGQIADALSDLRKGLV